MKKYLKFMLVVCLLFVMTSCGKPSLVGRWESESDHLEFFSDGTYSSNDANYQGGYSVDGDRIKLQGYLMPDRTYTFKIQNNNLIFYNNDGEVMEEFKKVQ